MKTEIMKQKIGSVLCSMFNHIIEFESEDERYIYVRIDNSVVSHILLGELIEQGLRFVIDLYDCVNGSIVIAFIKE